MIIKGIFSDAATEVLKEAGLVKPLPAGTNDKNQLPELLAQSSLSLAQTIEELSNLAHTAGNEGVRLNALNTAFKLHKVLEPDEIAKAPMIQINIVSPNVNSIPSILVPRQIQIEGA